MKWIDRSRMWIKIMFLVNIVTLGFCFVFSCLTSVFVIGMFGLGLCLFNYYANCESMKDVETEYFF
jgi:hypothetical protein